MHRQGPIPMKNPSRWWEHALCKGLDANIWFPEKPQGRDYFARARTYCERCPVRQPCLEEALSVNPDDDRFGMYGGFTPKERDRIREGKSPFGPPIVEIGPTRPVQRQPEPKEPEIPPIRGYVRQFMVRNKPDLDEMALRRTRRPLKDTKIPKQTQLVMNVTPMIGASQLTAQALAAMIMAGWEDPMEARTAAALFMGASYVAELARQGVESGVLSPQENAAVQGVAELAMQVWKYHATNAKMDT